MMDFSSKILSPFFIKKLSNKIHYLHEQIWVYLPVLLMFYRTDLENRKFELDKGLCIGIIKDD